MAAWRASRHWAGSIFTELQHSEPRKLPAHSHELPFFCLCSAGITLRSTATAMCSFGLSPVLIVRRVFRIKTRSVDAAHACSALKSSADGSAA